MHCDWNSLLFHESTTHSLFSSCLMQASTELCVTETVHQMRYCQFVWHRGIRKFIFELILASEGRIRYYVSLDNEDSLHP